MLNGTAFPAFSTWAKNMLLEWSKQDPVSQKEIDRNNDVYNLYQHNRNPFIDHPEYAELIWSDGITPVQFTSTPSTTIVTGNNYQYNITVSGEAGATIAITCTQKPAWLTFSNISNGSATLAGTPTSADIGNYSIAIAASDGTTSAEQNFTLSVNSTTTDTQNNYSELIHLYPNPAETNLTIDINNLHIQKCMVVNILGLSVFNSRLTESKTVLDLSDIQAGVYFLILKGNNLTITKRFVKK
jgi:hypothetical protein